MYKHIEVTSSSPSYKEGIIIKGLQDRVQLHSCVGGPYGYGQAQCLRNPLMDGLSNCFPDTRAESLRTVTGQNSFTGLWICAIFIL
jgi:hypothetical protein